MQADEAPQALKHHFLVAHVGHRIDQTYAVESELDEVTLAALNVQVVASQAVAVLDFRLVWVEAERIRCLDMVVDDISWQDTALSLWQIEAWKLFFEAIKVGLRVVDVENTASESRAHLSSVVAVHSQRLALAKSLIPTRELAQATSSENGWIGCLEALVNDQSSIVHKTVIVN